MGNISLTPLDIILIILFFFFFIWWGIKNGKGKGKDSQSYFLANRTTPWQIIGLSLFAASISSTTLIGHSGDTYHTGISVYNYNLTGIIVMILFAIFLLPLYIKSNVFTIPEFLEKRFDRRSRYYFSAICIFANIFMDAAGALYAGALIIKLIYPEANLQFVILVFAAIAASYTIPGGLTSVIKTELIQAIVLIFSSLILLYFSVKQGAEYFITLWDNSSILIKLIRPLNDASTPWLGVMLGMPIMGVYYWANNQTIVQRVLSAKNIDEGRKGLVFAGFLILVGMLIIIIPGLLAGGIFPDLHNPDLVYPTLIVSLIPVGIRAIILVSLFAALITALRWVL